MKTSAKYLSLIVAAGTAGVALFALASAPFTSAFRGDIAFAIPASVALIGFAVYDYSRRVTSLSAPARVLRPSLPTRDHSPRTIAYGVKSSPADRLAA